MSSPCLATSRSLPSDSLRRVINSSVSGGRDIAQPSAARVGLLDSVCKLIHFKSLFSLPSVFSSSGWCYRRLSFPKLFQLWDFSPSFYRALSLKHRQWVWDHCRLPPRDLGFLLRLFLSGADVAVGVGSDVKDKKRGLLSSDAEKNNAKRNKVCFVNSADTLELKLLSMDGNLDELNSKVQSCNSISKKGDDAPISIVCWLYWLNGGLSHNISPVD